MDRAARCSLLPVFHPCKVWIHHSALSTPEHSLARKFQIWLSLHFTVGFCVNGECVLLVLNWYISAMESVHFTSICISAGLSTILVSSLLPYQSLLLSCSCFNSVMCQVVPACSVWVCPPRYFVMCLFILFLRLSANLSPNWASEMNLHWFQDCFWGPVCLFVFCCWLSSSMGQKKELMNVCLFQTLLSHWSHLHLEKLLPVEQLHLELLG